MIGTVSDNIRYMVTVVGPASKDETSLRRARVVADAQDGFAYGKRMVYDWRFDELPSGATRIRLDILFQASSIFTLPLWDGMQGVITRVMMKKFVERAAFLKKERANREAVAAASTRTSAEPEVSHHGSSIREDARLSEYAELKSQSVNVDK